ncbi:hypothetical protein I3842_07G197900 [Carya illinoinensis]|uniref:DUF630 family protein n=1 Tax=Carya illinoinensis TaxID=32201 RepID=A0A922JHK3_CARIL|nr:hypothetical protein I3842_07G197900 [Carya illinoinensis]
MGCSTSKLDDEEAVQLCKDRKRFIKQAVEERSRFASGHIAYIQSLKRVSAALRDYIDGDEPREFLLDSFITPPFTPAQKSSPSFITFSSKSLPSTPIQSQPNSCVKVNYLRSGGEPAVLVEERPQSPETVRVETYAPMHHFGIDGFFEMQSSQLSSSFFSYSPINRPNIPPPSPQASQWDFFWNPFSSVDYYGYPTRSSFGHSLMDDDIGGLRHVREEEGIPELEEETEQEESDDKVNLTEERAKIDLDCTREGIVEDIDEEEDEVEETDSATETEHQMTGLRWHHASIEVSKGQTFKEVETYNQEMAVGDREAKEETPGFTVYVNRRPTSMAEVVKDLESQFMIVCNSANKVSALLEASRAQYASTTRELTPMKMLNPVALFRSASSNCKSSSLINSSSSTDEGYESSGGYLEEPCVYSGCHQSTLERLFAWEKKLYEEVRSGEKVRIAYEKKCMQLRNQETKEEDPISVDKTRAAIRDLHTQMKVSIHSVEAISKRIETLRDEELQPQLLELVGKDVEGNGRVSSVTEADIRRSQAFTSWNAFKNRSGMGSIYAQQLREDSPHAPIGSNRYGGGSSEEFDGNMKMVEAGQVEEGVKTAEKMAEVAIRVLCAGMSVATSSLTEFAFSSAEGYAVLVKQWEKTK